MLNLVNRLEVKLCSLSMSVPRGVVDSLTGGSRACGEGSGGVWQPQARVLQWVKKRLVHVRGSCNESATLAKGSLALGK